MNLRILLGLALGLPFAFVSTAAANPVPSPCAPACPVIVTTSEGTTLQEYELTHTVKVRNVTTFKKVEVAVLPCGGQCPPPKPAPPTCHRGEVCRRGKPMKCSRRTDRSCPIKRRKAKSKRVVRVKKVERKSHTRVGKKPRLAG